jgi:hypothetical protein
MTNICLASTGCQVSVGFVFLLSKTHTGARRRRRAKKPSIKNEDPRVLKPARLLGVAIGFPLPQFILGL